MIWLHGDGGFSRMALEGMIMPTPDVDVFEMLGCGVGDLISARVSPTHCAWCMCHVTGWSTAAISPIGERWGLGHTVTNAEFFTDPLPKHWITRWRSIRQERAASCVGCKPGDLIKGYRYNKTAMLARVVDTDEIGKPVTVLWANETEPKAAAFEAVQWLLIDTYPRGHEILWRKGWGLQASPGQMGLQAYRQESSLEAAELRAQRTAQPKGGKKAPAGPVSPPKPPKPLLAQPDASAAPPKPDRPECPKGYDDIAWSHADLGWIRQKYPDLVWPE